MSKSSRTRVSAVPQSLPFVLALAILVTWAGGPERATDVALTVSAPAPVTISALN